MASRIGGDEFAILLPYMIDAVLVKEFAETVIQNIALPIVIDGQEVRIAASCGASITPLQAHEALELESNAGLALFKAKSLGRGSAYSLELSN